MKIVPGKTNHVARRQGAKEGQHQIRAGTNAPGAQRLGEIFVMALNSHGFCRVKKSKKPNHRVDAKTRQRVARAAGFCLQQIVQKNYRAFQIIQKIGCRFPCTGAGTTAR